MRTCARLGLPLLIHAGGEFTLRTQHRAWRPVTRWLAALRYLRGEGAMPPVILAHVATPVVPWRERRELRTLVDALRGEFRDAPLYADISALTAWAKLGFLRRFAREQDLHGKLLFGSDFPVPLGRPLLDWRISRAGRGAFRACSSWPQQAALACLDAGYQEIVFQRAASVLPNVQAFSAG
jgi:predicted TIM-barrel fold metal-dependent hydrolase